MTRLIAVTLLAISFIFGCSNLVKKTELAIKKCPSEGKGNIEGDPPKIITQVPSGYLLVCGFLNKKISNHSYDMSEFYIYSSSGKERRTLLKVSAIENRIIHVQKNGDLRVINQIYAPKKTLDIFEQLVSCDKNGCTVSSEKCLFKRSKVNPYKTFVSSVKNKQKLLEVEDQQFKLFLAALFGYKPAQEVFKKPMPSGLFGNVAENFLFRSELLQKIKKICHL